MDLKKCKILLDAIDYRNLSKVAKDYGYTPSGIWHMIDTIENELGFPLFIRNSGSVARIIMSTMRAAGSCCCRCSIRFHLRCIHFQRAELRQHL